MGGGTRHTGRRNGVPVVHHTLRARTQTGMAVLGEGPLAKSPMECPLHLFIERARFVTLHHTFDGILQADMAILDEIDSGLDIDALRDVAKAVNALKGEETGVLMVTHYKVRYAQRDGGVRCLNRMAAYQARSGHIHWLHPT